MSMSMTIPFCGNIFYLKYTNIDLKAKYARPQIKPDENNPDFNQKAFLV